MRQHLFSDLIVTCGIVLIGTSALGQSEATATFKEKCQACHGETGRADTNIGKALAVPSFTDASIMRKSDSELISAIKTGSGKMPAFRGTLQESEIPALVQYVRHLQGRN